MKAVDQFRRSFPSSVDANTLKKFNIAPGNESYVINTLRFLGFMDDEGKKVDGNVAFFYGTDEQFASGMEAAVQNAYGALFEDHGDGAWTRGRDELASWFRVTDKTSELVGSRQAATFRALAAFGGHGDVPARPPATSGSVPAAPRPKGRTASTPRGSETPAKEVKPPHADGHRESLDSDVGLTVRIEVNLPAGGSAEDYDAIFASIRKNLMDRG